MLRRRQTPEAAQGQERRMTHLIAVAQRTAIPRAHEALLPDGAAKLGQPAPEHRAICPPAMARSVFCSPVTNFLEMSRHGFHYSVIGEYATVSMACEWAGSFPLNDEALSSSSRGGMSGALQLPFTISCATKRRPQVAHVRVINDALDFLALSKFRPAKERLMQGIAVFSNQKQLDIDSSGASMRQLSENINATHPLQAAAAPILLEPMGKISAGCSITLNSGAANESDG